MAETSALQVNDPAVAVGGGARSLRAKPIALNTFRENVILLARNNPVVRPERLAGVRRVEIAAGERRLLAVPMICDDANLVGPSEIGLPEPVFRRLGVGAGDLVEISLARAPLTLDSIRAKIEGQTLTARDYEGIARDLAAHRLSDMEVAAFLVASAAWTTPEETLALAHAMVAAGETLDWGRTIVVDKHCIGGVPGNRTSLIVTPIVAAHGLTMPKTSSRAITSPAGTADTMEVLARVDLDEAEMRQVVETCGACIAWGGRVNLSPADDVLISVERPLSIDTPEQMAASILSKKVAAGSTHLILDVPVGPTTKIRDRTSALRLKKLFEFVARGVGLTVEVVLTEAPEPIGWGIGPVLEAQDVMAVLENRPNAPRDLREKAIRLAGRVLEFDPALSGGTGERRARDLLESGAAREKMAQICEAQGASPISGQLGNLAHDVVAARSGRIAAIDCLRIATIARLAGAPTDPGAGLVLLRKTGDEVRAGEPLYRVHGSEPADFRFATEAAATDCGVRIG